MTIEIPTSPRFWVGLVILILVFAWLFRGPGDDDREGK